MKKQLEAANNSPGRGDNPLPLPLKAKSSLPLAQRWSRCQNSWLKGMSPLWLDSGGLSMSQPKVSHIFAKKLLAFSSEACLQPSALKTEEEKHWRQPSQGSVISTILKSFKIFIPVYRSWHKLYFYLAFFYFSFTFTLRIMLFWYATIWLFRFAHGLVVDGTVVSCSRYSIWNVNQFACTEELKAAMFWILRSRTDVAMNPKWSAGLLLHHCDSSTNEHNITKTVGLQCSLFQITFILLRLP